MWKNHGAYVQCVEQVAGKLYAQGKITSTQRTALITAAASSKVGS